MIVFPQATDITNPGRELGHGDKLTRHLGKISDMLQTENARLTFGAGIGFL